MGSLREGAVNKSGQHDRGWEDIDEPAAKFRWILIDAHAADWDSQLLRRRRFAQVYSEGALMHELNRLREKSERKQIRQRMSWQGLKPNSFC